MHNKRAKHPIYNQLFDCTTFIGKFELFKFVGYSRFFIFRVPDIVEVETIINVFSYEVVLGRDSNLSPNLS